MQKPKVLHTITWLAKGGGVDNNVFLTIKELQHKYTFHLVTGKEIHFNLFDQLPNVQVHVCPYLIRKISPFEDIKALIWLYKHIKKEQYDIVHTHETKASLLSRIAAYFAKVPFIIYGLHGVTFNDPMSKLKRSFYIYIEKTTIWMNDLIVSVSQATLDEYRKVNIGNPLPKKVVYSGIDIQKFVHYKISEEELANERKQLGIQPNDLVLVNVGRFSYSKAQRYTIEAFAKLKSTFPHLKLLLVGEGPLKEACKQQAKTLGIEEAVIFYGFSDHIPHVMSLADISVLTSLREGLPRVVVEASLMKKPTVAFEVEGIHEIITHEKSGFIAPSGEVNTLSGYLEILIKDSDGSKKMAQKAYEKAITHWDHLVMTRELDQIYKSTAHA